MGHLWNNLYKVLRHKMILWYSAARLMADESRGAVFLFILLAGLALVLGYAAYNRGPVKTSRSWMPPKILLDLPGNVAQANIVLRDVLKKKFPPGTPESGVLEDLGKEGFRIGLDSSSHRQYAFYQIDMGPPTKRGQCQALCLIDWDLTGDHVIDDFHVSQSTLCGRFAGRPPLP